MPKVALCQCVLRGLAKSDVKIRTAKNKEQLLVVQHCSQLAVQRYSASVVQWYSASVVQWPMTFKMIQG